MSSTADGCRSPSVPSPRSLLLTLTCVRKRMSVVVRIGNGSPILLCKGADSSMFPFCLTGPYTTQVDRLLTLTLSPHLFPSPFVQCKEHVDDFASSGLRTLVMAKSVKLSRSLSHFSDPHAGETSQKSSSSLGSRSFSRRLTV